MLPPIIALLMAAPSPDFDTEVLPVLTRAGCNSGACHGAAAGRGGLKLSLWGSNPSQDHDALVRELESRRVNLRKPAASLMILKPTGQLGHGGGRRLAPDGDGARRVLRWIEAGATRSDNRKLVRFEVQPSDKLLAGVGDTVSLQAVARFNDSCSDDVTAWTVFTATDPGSIEVDPTGSAKVLRAGQHTVLARFLDRVVAVRLTVPVGSAPVDLSGIPRHNFIDDEIVATLDTLRLPAAPTCDDAAFLRRVTLDLAGRLPTLDEQHEFLTNIQPDKRSRAVDRLLASHDFVEYWTLKWCNLLQLSSQRLGREAAQALHDWLQSQVATNRPLDATARDLLTAIGDAKRVGPANFSRIPADAREQAEYLSRVFLGVRLQCANCHDHPLDRWTQDDYHGLASIFARVERGPVVKLVGFGEIIHPRTGEPAVSRLPGERFLALEGDHREELARWVVSNDNALFARAAVNRLWKELMGRGLVEPVDDLRATNPSTHPRLLERLAADFVGHGHDVRRTIRLIVTSATYQRASIVDSKSPPDDRFYSRALIRPLGPEVQADAIAVVTGVADRYGTLAEGMRAIAVFDPAIPAPALDLLGRCPRTGPCENAAVTGSLSRVLHMINGGLLNDRITSPQGRLAKLLASRRSNEEIVDELYRLALGRSPTSTEREHWAKHLPHKNTDERRKAFEDFVWAILTSREFTTNH